MTQNENTSGGWRKRAIATVGVAAAVAAAGVAMASSASAAAPAPVLTVTAPASLANNGQGSGLYTLEINNSATGNAAITGSLAINFTAPTGVACANIALANTDSNPDTALPPTFGPTATGTTPNCTFTDAAYVQPANSDYTFSYALSVTATGATAATGNLLSQAALTVTTVTGGNTNTAVTNSNSTTTALLAPAAPTVSSTTPPAAVIYQNYSANVVTSPGTPTATPDDYSIFEAPAQKNSDGTYPNTGGTLTVDSTVGKNDDPAIELEDGLYFDTVTGSIVGSTNATDSSPEFTYTVIVNNGQGGATTASPANQGGNTAKPTAAVAVHDVQSAPFTIPVLFSDVATTAPLAGGVYGLSNDGAIKGFADGTFRPGQSVTRQEFVNILANYLQNGEGTTNGECSTIRPSAFSDVPNSSVFCQAIKELSQVHIINGTGAGKFSPSAVVSRQEIAAIVYRANAYAKTGNVLNGDAKFTSPSPFSDVTASNVFAGDIEWAATNKIVNGYPDGTFRPRNATTRDAAAAVIFRTDLANLVTTFGNA